jgi:hypothetical protein
MRGEDAVAAQYPRRWELQWLGMRADLRGGNVVFAVFTIVEMEPGRNSAAVRMLKDELIPQVKQTPGFVRGTWFGDDEVGHGIVVFETEKQAGQAGQPINSIVLDGVRVVRSDVYRIDAEA